MDIWKNQFIQQAWKRLFQQKKKKIFDALKKSKTTSKPQKYFRISQKNLDLKKHF